MSSSLRSMEKHRDENATKSPANPHIPMFQEGDERALPVPVSFSIANLELEPPQKWLVDMNPHQHDINDIHQRALLKLTLQREIMGGKAPL